MKIEDALNLVVGDKVLLTDFERTPGRKFEFPIQEKKEVEITSLINENNRYVHIDIGMKISDGGEPLCSRDTGNVIDGSSKYWMHYSRFEKING